MLLQVSCQQAPAVILPNQRETSLEKFKLPSAPKMLGLGQQCMCGLGAELVRGKDHMVRHPPSHPGSGRGGGNPGSWGSRGPKNEAILNIRNGFGPQPRKAGGNPPLGGALPQGEGSD